jgi:SHS2 domain-containing protein
VYNRGKSTVFEILDHTADVGFRARGRTKAELFANAALALMSVAVDTDTVQPRRRFPIAAAGEDDESLLVNWLSEVLYYLDGERVVMRRFEVDELEAGAVRGRGWGEPWEAQRHSARVIVKGVTYHQLKLAKDSQGWCAEVYLDI